MYRNVCKFYVSIEIKQHRISIAKSSGSNCHQRKTQTRDLEMSTNSGPQIKF